MRVVVPHPQYTLLVVCESEPAAPPQPLDLADTMHLRMAASNGVLPSARVAWSSGCLRGTHTRFTYERPVHCLGATSCVRPANPAPIVARPCVRKRLRLRPPVPCCRRPGRPNSCTFLCRRSLLWTIWRLDPLVAVTDPMSSTLMWAFLYSY